MGIDADDGNRLQQGLGNQQAIERVAMVERQRLDGCGVRDGNGKQYREVKWTPKTGQVFKIENVAEAEGIF